MAIERSQAIMCTLWGKFRGSEQRERDPDFYFCSLLTLLSGLSLLSVLIILFSWISLPIVMSISLKYNALSFLVEYDS